MNDSIEKELLEPDDTAVFGPDNQLNPEYLEFMDKNGLLHNAYLCRISAAGNLPAQWLVLDDAFAGYSEAEAFIRKLPPYLAQRHPYVRNVRGIACTNS